MLWFGRQDLKDTCLVSDEQITIMHRYTVGPAKKIFRTEKHTPIVTQEEMNINIPLFPVLLLLFLN